MQILVNTNSGVEGSQSLTTKTEASLEHRLGRFYGKLTRIDVHLSDENGSKSGEADKRCMLETRPPGMQPIIVTQHSATVDEAVQAATHALERILDDTFHRLEEAESQRARDRTGG